VTGANGGLGLEISRALAGRGAHVVMASRNQEKARNAEADIRESHPGASLEVRELDLASLESVASFAQALVENLDHVDLLINNAGVMGIPEGRTEDGFEMQLGVNHLGHFALTAHLLPLLVVAPDSRVVSVTSTARHFGSTVDPDNPNLEDEYEPWKAYGQSKLANVHFALGLDRQFEAAGAETQSLVAHPGLTHTDLQNTSVRETDGGASQRFFQVLAHRVGMTPARGALPVLRAATDPDASGSQLYTPRFVNFGDPVRRTLLSRSRDTESIETLFETSAKMTGVTLDVEAAMEKTKA
jgi:NAD(P)-dependent dehydrogenase (short-subunit alcohol dehydrogenase family)